MKDRIYCCILTTNGTMHTKLAR